MDTILSVKSAETTIHQTSTIRSRLLSLITTIKSSPCQWYIYATFFLRKETTRLRSREDVGPVLPLSTSSARLFLATVNNPSVRYFEIIRLFLHQSFSNFSPSCIRLPTLSIAIPTVQPANPFTLLPKSSDGATGWLSLHPELCKPTVPLTRCVIFPSEDRDIQLLYYCLAYRESSFCSDLLAFIRYYIDNQPIQSSGERNKLLVNAERWVSIPGNALHASIRPSLIFSVWSLLTYLLLSFQLQVPTLKARADDQGSTITATLVVSHSEAQIKQVNTHSCVSL